MIKIRLLFLFLMLPLLVRAEVQYEETFVDSDGARLFCRMLGKGKPLIVVHGGPGMSQDYLLPYFAQLAENNFVIFYDQRGGGRSTGEINRETINIPTFVRDIENIRHAFNLEKISILGHSWGGLLAMHYAIAHPQSIDKLILSNSSAASSEDFQVYFEEHLRRIAPFQEEFSAVCATKEFQAGEPRAVERFYRLLFRTYCYDPEKVGLLNFQQTPMAFINGGKIYEILRGKAFSNFYDLYPSLKTLNVTTLIVHGDTDTVPAATAQKIHKCVHGSKFVLLRQCGHFPFVEQEKEYFACLKEFLE
jgi:proline iminopeptidase